MRVSLMILGLSLSSSVAVAEDKAPDLVGKYTFTTTSTMKLKTPVAKTTTDTTMGQLIVSTSAKADLLFTWSIAGSVCHLRAKRVGANEVKFMKGETCTLDDAASKSELTLSLENGLGTVIDNDLTLTFSWTLSGTMGGQSASGSATAVTTCDKR